jgi:hypothetical protein
MQEALGMAAFPEQLREATSSFLQKGELKRTSANGGTPTLFTSKVVAENDLLSYVDEGLEIVQELSNGKIVVRKPN